MKSWDTTTWFRIWQFQTPAWKRYLQKHLLARRFVSWGWWSGFSERWSQDLSNNTNAASWLANFYSVFTSVVCGSNTVQECLRCNHHGVRQCLADRPSSVRLRDSAKVALLLIEKKKKTSRSKLFNWHTDGHLLAWGSLSSTDTGTGLRDRVYHLKGRTLNQLRNGILQVPVNSATTSLVSDLSRGR